VEGQDDEVESSQIGADDDEREWFCEREHDESDQREHREHQIVERAGAGCLTRPRAARPEDFGHAAREAGGNPELGDRRIQPPVNSVSVQKMKP
jgi:hypothetical protein